MTKKKNIKLTRDNIQYYLRDLCEWADHNGFRNASVVINFADDVIEELKSENYDLEHENKELNNRITENWEYPDLES